MSYRRLDIVGAGVVANNGVHVGVGLLDRRAVKEWRSESSRLQKAEVTDSIENDVVEQFDADNLPGPLQLLRGLDVGWRWFEASCWVVVRDDDAGGALSHGIGKHFSRVNRAAVDQADGDHPDVLRVRAF